MDAHNPLHTYNIPYASQRGFIVTYKLILWIRYEMTYKGSILSSDVWPLPSVYTQGIG